jgi:hypothetical protein
LGWAVGGSTVTVGSGTLGGDGAWACAAPTTETSVSTLTVVSSAILQPLNWPFGPLLKRVIFPPG